MEKPAPLSEAVTKSMKGNKSRLTRPERLLRASLASRGLRGFRLNAEGLPGQPDIAFEDVKVAVFVHGCFWHSCPLCLLKRPVHNADFWREKLERNRYRDARDGRRLRNMGWTVVVVWEHEIKEDLRACAMRVIFAVARRRHFANLSG